LNGIKEKRIEGKGKPVTYIYQCGGRMTDKLESVYKSRGGFGGRWIKMEDKK
jgi:hypothetical protein